MRAKLISVPAETGTNTPLLALACGLIAANVYYARPPHRRPSWSD